MSEQRPAAALSLADVMGELSWLNLLRALDQPERLLHFRWRPASGGVKISTRPVADPKNPDHVIAGVTLAHDDCDLQPVVLVTRAERRAADRVRRPHPPGQRANSRAKRTATFAKRHDSSAKRIDALVDSF
ncbi:uncharacterized protein LOC119089335 [Pollicipes pollicipes]|uniref:uncharacterized protein LOC119089335 n=1 Tax=Pollicipes pollicipes TaxID=41117 RepID=UPI00188532B9|nr:uncharacterized protein LOC119089335 [Pollicipes pollicipes]